MSLPHEWTWTAPHRACRRLWADVWILGQECEGTDPQGMSWNESHQFYHSCIHRSLSIIQLLWSVIRASTATSLATTLPQLTTGCLPSDPFHAQRSNIQWNGGSNQGTRCVNVVHFCHLLFPAPWQWLSTSAASQLQRGVTGIMISLYSLSGTLIIVLLCPQVTAHLVVHANGGQKIPPPSASSPAF